MATCAEAAGAEYPAQLDGRPITPSAGVSLLPAFQDLPLRREAIYWEHEGNRAVRAGDWKLVAQHGGDWELYDLSADRSEVNNLAEKEPQRVRRLLATYLRWAHRCGVLPWPPKRAQPK
jgi:arylsulfatase